MSETSSQSNPDEVVQDPIKEEDSKKEKDDSASKESISVPSSASGILSPVDSDGKTGSTREIEEAILKDQGSRITAKKAKRLVIKHKTADIIDFIADYIEDMGDEIDTFELQELLSHLKIGILSYEILKKKRILNVLSDIGKDTKATDEFAKESVIACIKKICEAASSGNDTVLKSIVKSEIADAGARVIDLEKKKNDLKLTIIALEKTILDDLKTLGEGITDSLILSRMIINPKRFDMSKIGDAYFRTFYSEVTEVGVHGWIMTASKFIYDSFAKFFSSNVKKNTEERSIEKPVSIGGSSKSSVQKFETTVQSKPSKSLNKVKVVPPKIFS